MAYRGPIPLSSSNMMGRLVRIIKNKAPAYRDMMLDNLIGILFCHTSVLLQVETRTCIFLLQVETRNFFFHLCTFVKTQSLLHSTQLKATISNKTKV